MNLNKDTILSDRYNIRALLGKGGMGVVYRAVDQQLRREVAIKTIQGDKAVDGAFLKRFKREALAISQIDHPHIVRLIDFVEASADQPPYMVMELLTGKDMDTVIREERALDITRAVTRVLEASVAIAECHRHGYLHRDVKPSNIFFHQYNRVETTKVLDFGTVKQDEQQEDLNEDSAELTHKGFILGTPYYMPAEQIAGKPVTAKSDQYSLAVVLYSAIAGRKPFELKAPKKDFKNLDLAQAIRLGNYTPIQKIRADVPAALAEAIHRAMSLDPEKRFPDLHAFGGALRPFASPQARLTWEAHFTGDAPARRNPQLSMAMAANDGSAVPTARRPYLDPTFTSADPSRGTGPTVRAKAANETIALTTAELKEAAAEPTLATTTKRQAGGASRSISIEIDEASPVGPAPSTPSEAEAAGETTSRPLGRNKPALIVLGAASMLAVVLVVSFFLSHPKPAAPLVVNPPPDLMNRAASAASAPSSPPAASAAPAPPPPAAPAPSAPSVVPAPSVASISAAPAAPKRHARKRTVTHAVLDPHGIPIPTE